MDRLREIDPSAAPKSQPMSPGGSPQITEQQIRKMMEDMQKKKGGAPPPPPPPGGGK
jgi:hypothetical protein